MDFGRLAFSIRQAEAEFASFTAWVAERDYFAEADIMPPIAARPHMACLLGFTMACRRPT